jgi:hypothetical protein
METTQEALYLFCIARADLVQEVDGKGVDGHYPLHTYQFLPDLCAIVSHVPLEDFCGEAAELNMQQLAWVGPRALRHEGVIEQVMSLSPVLPVGFGTLFSSQESLAEFVQAHRETITQFLRGVEGLEEWSVKGLLDRKQALQGLISSSMVAQQKELDALNQGTRYFHEVGIRSAAEKKLAHWLNQTCRHVADELVKQASDFRECAFVSAEPAKGVPEVVVNWACLLPQGATAAFRLRIDQLNQDHAATGLVFELSGPWPPYRFVPPLSMGGGQ